MADNEVMTAERITAPVIEVQLLGEKRELRFDNRAAMLAERYWRETMGQQVSYQMIISELAHDTIGGLMSVVYGAMASAQMHRNLSRKSPEPVLSCRAFEESAHWRTLVDRRQEIINAVIRSLPVNQKNAKSPGETGAGDGPGTP